MNILMISTDLSLLGEKVSTGDAVGRHKKYGSYVESLSIIVLAREKYATKKLASNIRCHSASGRSRLRQIRQVEKIAKRIKEDKKIDLIVCQDPFFTGIAGVNLKKAKEFADAKLLVHMHGDFFNKYWVREKPIRLVLYPFYRKSLKEADAIRVVSEPLRRKLIKMRIKKEKIKVIPTPVNLDKMREADAQTIKSIRDEFQGRLILLWVGKMKSEKNIPFLLKVFQKLISRNKNLALILVGSGDDFSKIEESINDMKLGSYIKMTGNLDYDVLRNYFHASDIFVFPSRHESYGKVLLESAMAGKPTVASATTGAKSVLKDGETGIIVPINNQKQFVSALMGLVEDEEKRIEMGKRAYEYVEKSYDYNFGVASVVGYWSEIIDG